MTRNGTTLKFQYDFPARMAAVADLLGVGGAIEGEYAADRRLELAFIGPTTEELKVLAAAADQDEFGLAGRTQEAGKVSPSGPGEQIRPGHRRHVGAPRQEQRPAFGK